MVVQPFAYVSGKTRTPPALSSTKGRQVVSQQFESLPEVAAKLYAELGETASYNRCWRAGLFTGLLVKRGRCWHVPTEKVAQLRAAVLALPGRRTPSAA